MKDADFEELNLENEKEEDFDLSSKRTIFTEQGDPEVDSLYRRHLKGRLNVQPDFQRQFVWDKIKSSRLIESALLDIPIPIIYLSEEPDGKDNVIDGQQRLTAFFSFIDGKFPDNSNFKLVGLNVFTELNGKKFNELSEDTQDKITTTKIRVIKFKKESDGDLQFEIFARLNTGAVPLNDQELRNCVYRGRFNVLLKELSELKDYRYLLGISKPEKRMRDVELVLRFASFYFNSYLDYNSPIKGFLNSTMKKYQNISSDDEYSLRNAFKNTVAIIRSLFGNNAFKRFYSGREKNINGRWETQKFNVSLYDILMYSFAKEDKNTVYQNIDRIREALLDLMTADQDFIDSIELGTSSKKMITVRFDKWRLTLQTILGIGAREPRCFSYALKQLLFEKDSNCSICGNKILNIDDAAVDHIDQYWTGGRTIPENARLAHRFCNNSRSRRENINIDSELSENSVFFKANKVGELKSKESKKFTNQKITRDPRPKKTIEELFEGANQELFSLFTMLDETILGISSEIERYTTSIEVLYKTSFNFVCLAAQKKNNRIRIYLRTIQDKISDPKRLTEKVPKEFGYGNITRVMYLDPKDVGKKYFIGDIMELIMQSYNTTQ
jgi:uncharacterized protein with ParB-like and HNH nuclease domain/predicted transport protein